jgi:polyribonucleotide nucleotidyltransferase
VLEVNGDGKIRLSRKALLEKPEGYVEEERHERPRGPRPEGGREGGQGGRRREHSRPRR